VERALKIIIDTNIICQDYSFVGPEFRLFLKGLKSVNGKLFISDVVIDEAVNRYRLDLEEAVNIYNKSERILYKLLNLVT
jgi:hypothetical protein